MRDDRARRIKVADLARDEQRRAEGGVLRKRIGAVRDHDPDHLVARHIHIAREVQGRRTCGGGSSAAGGVSNGFS